MTELWMRLGLGAVGLVLIAFATCWAWLTLRFDKLDREWARILGRAKYRRDVVAWVLGTLLALMCGAGGLTLLRLAVWGVPQ